LILLLFSSKMTMKRILLIALLAMATYTVTVTALGKCTPEDGEFDAEKCRIKCENKEKGSGEGSLFEATDRGGAKTYRCTCAKDGKPLEKDGKLDPVCKDAKFDPNNVEQAGSFSKSPLLALLAPIAAAPLLRA